MAEGKQATDLVLDGRLVTVPTAEGTLLDALRDHLGVRSAKDGCSPQGQCGCCTVLVDGQPRVACVTPLRRVAGRRVTTVDGLDDDAAGEWSRALCATGGSQCGFCTPGIVVRLEAARRSGDAAADRALLAHLCRCTGWQPIEEAWRLVREGDVPADPWIDRDPAAAAARAALETGGSQAVGTDVALGRAPFAADTAPTGALVAVPAAGAAGGWALGATVAEARAAAGKVQGRRTTIDAAPPLDAPPGDWVRVLRTSWVEPAYLEPDASWCEPGGSPSSPLANGGAFGGKVSSPAPAVAQRLADEHGRPVLAVLDREDTVRLGPKRPPLAAGIDANGRAEVRVARTPGITAAVAAGLAAADAGGEVQLTVEEVDVVGPPTSASLRAAGWAEMAVLVAGWRGDREVTVRDPSTGALATARVEASDDGAIAAVHVRVDAGLALDEVTLRSYATGAAHQALGWATSEGLAVNDPGEVLDLTIRSFGVLRAVDTPPIEVEVVASDRPAVRGGDAVFAAVAGAVWVAQGCPPTWPTGPAGRTA